MCRPDASLIAAAAVATVSSSDAMSIRLPRKLSRRSMTWAVNCAISATAICCRRRVAGNAIAMDPLAMPAASQVGEKVLHEEDRRDDRERHARPPYLLLDLELAVEMRNGCRSVGA